MSPYVPFVLFGTMFRIGLQEVHVACVEEIIKYLQSGKNNESVDHGHMR